MRVDGMVQYYKISYELLTASYKQFYSKLIARYSKLGSIEFRTFEVSDTTKAQ